MKNKVVIAAAGSGKTTYLVREALKVPPHEQVIVTTFTESNEAEIRRRFIETHGCVPGNVRIETWFSFLIEHGVKPFQGFKFDFDVAGMVLVNTQSGVRFRSKRGHPVTWPESDLKNHFFDGRGNIFSDKLAKLVIRLNEASGGLVFDRIARVFKHVFLDEVQDLAGYDLDIIASLFLSDARVLAVGDPRQVTYLTHHEARHKQYREGKILEFLERELPKRLAYEVDDKTLKYSHRNNASICTYAARLYPQMTSPEPCVCCKKDAADSVGMFLVAPADAEEFLVRLNGVQLRYSADTKVLDGYPAFNFGVSKGLGFDHVLIYPTMGMVAWLKDNSAKLAFETRAKFYVGITRARFSVGIVVPTKEQTNIDGCDPYRR